MICSSVRQTWRCPIVTKFLSRAQVLDKTSFSHATLYREISQGRFPRPVQLTARRVAWPEERIEEWLAERVSESDAA
ncbi:MAG: AlpA family transcriptional regulator [Rhizobiales bacterium]|nr:AlpA family transcriptional regulator [Hyphomicrobiales bacterium]